MDRNNENIVNTLNWISQYTKIKEDLRFVAISKINSYRSSYFIYYQNYRSFKRTIEAFYNSGLFRRKSLVKRWKDQHYIARDIFNLISSGIAYVDHSKVEYEEKVNEVFMDNDLFHFIRALRNFIIHEESLILTSVRGKKLIESGGVLSYQFESVDKAYFSSVLKRNIESKKKKGAKFEYDERALRFWSSLPKKANLNIVFDDFNEIISNYHCWLVLTHVDSNRIDLEYLYNRIKTFHQDSLLNGMSTSMPITPVQLRYLKYLLYLSKNIND